MKTQAFGYYPVMPTVLREDGFELMIYTNDHQPAHVHVHKAGAEAVIELDPVFLRDVIGMSKKNAR
jgi:hypothetical protein